MTDCTTIRDLFAGWNHLQRLLQGEAGGHDLPEQPQHLLVSERTLVPLEHASQYVRFPLGLPFTVAGFSFTTQLVVFDAGSLAPIPAVSSNGLCITVLP